MNETARLSTTHRILQWLRLGALPCFAGFFLGCTGCHLARLANADSVTAAALTGFIGSWLPLPKNVPGESVRAAIYSGAFAAMCANSVMRAPTEIFVVSVAGSVVYLLIAPYFQGIGGKLGMIAFVTTALVLLARTFL